MSANSAEAYLRKSSTLLYGTVTLAPVVGSEGNVPSSAEPGLRVLTV